MLSGRRVNRRAWITGEYLLIPVDAKLLTDNSVLRA
jgi:hypothetical protein